MIALDYTLRNELIPMESFCAFVTQAECHSQVMEDNQACQKIVEKGYSSQLRYLNRTQKISTASLHELLCSKTAPRTLHYCHTTNQAADIFTKPIKPLIWIACTQLVGLGRKPELDRLIQGYDEAVGGAPAAL